MKSCGYLGDIRAREVDNVKAVGFLVCSNGGVGLALLQSEHLGTLEVGIKSATFVPTTHVKENLLHHNGVIILLSTTLSTLKLELFFVRVVAANTTL